ncbi:MAG: hypothetical protein U0271_06490 [Polyangiaceae bacterium]
MRILIVQPAALEVWAKRSQRESAEAAPSLPAATRAEPRRRSGVYPTRRPARRLAEARPQAMSTPVPMLLEPEVLRELAAAMSEHELHFLDMRLEPEAALEAALVEFAPAVVVGLSEPALEPALSVVETAKQRLGSAVRTALVGRDLDELVALVASWSNTRARRRERGVAPDLAARYSSRYHFGVAGPVSTVSIARTTRSASWPAELVDRLEAARERVVFLDDGPTQAGLLDDPKLATSLAELLEQRGTNRYFIARGSTRAIAANAQLVRRLRDAGLVMVVSAIEVAEREANLRASRLLAEVGVFSAGVVEVSADLDEVGFDRLAAHLDELALAMPIVTLATRGVDAPVARLARERFYTRFVELRQRTINAWERSAQAVLRNRPRFIVESIPSTFAFVLRAFTLAPALVSAADHLALDALLTGESAVAVGEAPRSRRTGARAPASSRVA